MERFGERIAPGQSAFSQKLAADPVLRARCEAVARAVWEAARPDIAAAYRSTMLTAEDLAVTIVPCPIKFGEKQTPSIPDC